MNFPSPRPQKTASYVSSYSVSARENKVSVVFNFLPRFLLVQIYLNTSPKSDSYGCFD